MTAKKLPKVSYPKMKRGSYMLRVLFKDGTVKTHKIEALGPDSAIDAVDSYLHQFEGKKEIRELGLLTGGKEQQPPTETKVTETKPGLSQEVQSRSTSLKPENFVKSAEMVGRYLGTPKRVNEAFDRGYEGPFGQSESKGDSSEK